MKVIKLTKPWGMHAKDEVLTLADPLADLLLKRSAAIEIKEEKPKPVFKKQAWVK